MFLNYKNIKWQNLGVRIKLLKRVFRKRKESMGITMRLPYTGLQGIT